MRTFKDVEFRGEPIMFAAWPGMGNVGIIAIDYMRTKLGAMPFAEIDMTPFFIPDAIIVKDGLAQLPEIPGAVFHYVRDPAMIFLKAAHRSAGEAGSRSSKRFSMWQSSSMCVKSTPLRLFRSQ